MCQKLITQKVFCFSHSKVLKLDSINSQTVLINSWKALNVLKLDSILEVWESRIENRVSSIELWGTVNLPLSGTVHVFTCTVGIGNEWLICFQWKKPPLLLTAQVSKVAIFCYSGQRGKWAKYKIYTVGESSCEMFRKCLYLTCCSILFSSRINSLIPSMHSSMLCNLCSLRNEKTQHCLGENLGKWFPRCSKLEFYCQWFCRPLHTLVLSFSWFMLWSHRWSHRVCMVIVCSNCKYY